MLSLFVERNLQETIKFLLKNSSKIDKNTQMEPLFSPVDVKLDPLNLLSITFQNSKQYLLAYKTLLCESSKKHPNCIVFCPCCSSVRNFLRNYSLYNENKVNQKYENQLIIKIPGCRTDPFLDYITVLINKDINLLITIIESVPTFWEAHLLLIELTNKFVEIESPLKDYFFSYLKIIKDIPNFSTNNGINNTSNTLFKDTRDYLLNNTTNHLLNDTNNHLLNNTTNHLLNNINTNKLDVNTLAALNYCCGNIDLSLKLFKSIDDYSDVSFFEFFGMLLYNSNDPSFKTVVERCNLSNKYTPECLVVNGLYCLLNNNLTDARDYLKKAYKYKNSPDVACLIACCYVKLNDSENACSFYKMAGIRNFRILYTVAQGYFNMNRLDECFSYCKMALELGEDGSLNKLLGKIHNSKDNLELAEKYFEKSLRLGEIDSLLYLAEVYKKRNDSQRMVEMYERYLKVGEKNVATVAKYMIEYYEEKGDYSKASSYKEYINI